jgi:hypothetical protein
MADLVEHQRADGEGVLAEIRLVDSALGQEAAEGYKRCETAAGGRPAQQAALHPNPQMPLQAATQLSLGDLVEVQGIPPSGRRGRCPVPPIRAREVPTAASGE